MTMKLYALFHLDLSSISVSLPFCSISDKALSCLTRAITMLRRNCLHLPAITFSTCFVIISFSLHRPSSQLYRPHFLAVSTSLQSHHIPSSSEIPHIPHKYPSSPPLTLPTSSTHHTRPHLLNLISAPSSNPNPLFLPNLV